MQDEPSQYHNAAAYVYIGASHAFTLDEIWQGVDAAEAARISLDQVSRALSHNWPATVVALARKNIAVLRALIDEAAS
jgi:hypothetical protein